MAIVIRLIAVMGTDLTTVQAARVSFDVSSDTWNEVRDPKLIQFLADNEHTSPFRHIYISIYAEVSEGVARQWYKHNVGAAFTSDLAFTDTAWSEVSQRYVPVQEYYYPMEWRRQSKSSKQGSDLAHPLSAEEQRLAGEIYSDTIETIKRNYQRLLDLGVAREQARFVIPLGAKTKFRWTASLQAMENFCALRLGEGAQPEIAEAARALDEILTEKFPVSYGALKARRRPRWAIEHVVPKPVAEKRNPWPALAAIAVAWLGWALLSSP